MKKTCPALLLLFVATSLAQQEPVGDVSPQPEALADHMGWSVEGDFLIVRVPEARAVRLRREFADPKKAAGAREALLGLIETGEAQLVDWPVLQTVSGNRSVAENVQEIRYPIEFSRPNVVVSPVDGEVSTSTKAETPNAKAVKGRKDSAEPPAQKVVRVLAAIPSTFETRNVGVTVEFEPAVSPDGKQIDVQLAPQHVIFAGQKRATIEAEGHTVVVEQPQFRTQKTSTHLRLTSSQPVLYSFYKLKEPPGMVELMVLTLTARKSN